MDLRNHGRALADREHARHARLQRERQIVRRRHEALVIDRHVAMREPVGARIGAKEEEHVANGTRLGVARVAAVPGD